MSEPLNVALSRIFGATCPHFDELGLELLDSAPGRAVMRLPYSESLVGNLETAVLHGGAVTTLVDSACGFVAMTALPEPGPVATLDLRIDYLRPARAGWDLLVRADCYRVTRQIAFARAEAYHEDPDTPVAAALGTFMIAERPDAQNGLAQNGLAQNRATPGGSGQEPA